MSCCVLIITVHGFDEAETIGLICTLRRAGLCVKSAGVTSGLVSGAHGIFIMPDLTFSDLEAKANSFGMVILPENKHCLSKLESDPRLHSFLRRLLSEGGLVVAGVEGRQFLRKFPS